MCTPIPNGFICTSISLGFLYIPILPGLPRPLYTLNLSVLLYPEAYLYPYTLGFICTNIPLGFICNPIPLEFIRTPYTPRVYTYPHTPRIYLYPRVYLFPYTHRLYLYPKNFPNAKTLGRLVHTKKQLRKYASETCFAVTDPQSRACQSGSTDTRNNSDESVTSSCRDIKSHARIFHVRPVPATVRTSNGKTVINKINRRRQDSDEASGSIISETTIASGAATPTTKNVRLKLKRPKSTGNMGFANHVYGDTMNSAGTVTVYDPSYTSATIHSFDSQHPLAVPMTEERRASNFYMDDDSLHEFDDDGNGN